ncbi:DNA repair protein RadC [Sphingobacterium daejeonense]|uniref:RadC family protein n=1 Tax=Sphingobacterium daejeonense TaxID=371142 RepID=UPI0021A85EC3|nr:DNA repair protein RadC [Sphingobacterium daejeonense]MCT1529741.1 DNA repair protein RadC [Sphingobacterium daejeonense]
MSFQKLVIREWAESDRPREKLLEHGRRSVSDAELLAILIGSGSKNETAVELCKRLLNSVNNNLFNLSKLEVNDLCQFKGIGEAKAVSIIAALEIGRRRQNTEVEEKPILNNSKKAYAYLKQMLEDLNHEEFWVIFLNTSCKVIDKQMIGRGGNDFTPVDVRIILRFALLNKANSIILAHNHPSGTLKASEPDKILTRKILEAAKLMDIHVHDHLIITDDNYLSFRDEGLLT